MSKLRGVSILGGTVSISGTNAVSLGTDALADIKALRATEIQVKHGENHFRFTDHSANTILGEILIQLKINNCYLRHIVGDEITESDIEG